MRDLFRPEVLAAKRGSWLGSISVSQPASFWLITSFCVLSAALVVTFLIWGDYSRRSRVSGELIPDLGLSTVLAPTAGVVASLDVDEGDHVGKEARMLLINVPRITAAGDDAVQALREGLEARSHSLESSRDAHEQQLEIQHAGLKKQRDVLRRELSQIENEIETRAQQVEIARSIVERYRLASEEDYVSLLQLNQQEQAMLDLSSAQQALRRQATSIQRSLSQLDQSIAEIPEQVRAARASSARAIAELAGEMVGVETSGQMAVTAPVPGLVATRLIEVGQAVQAGQPLLSLLPDGSRLRAQLLVPSAAIGFVKPGDRVRLRYRAYPYQKFGSHEGTVIRISRSALPSPSNHERSEAVFRVLVSLKHQSVLTSGIAEPLKPGMIVEADIIGEKRRLYEWLLAPLYTVTGRSEIPGEAALE